MAECFYEVEGFLGAGLIEFVVHKIPTLRRGA